MAVVDEENQGRKRIGPTARCRHARNGMRVHFQEADKNRAMSSFPVNRLLQSLAE